MPRCGLRLPNMLQSIVHVKRGAVWLADGAERWLTDGDSLTDGNKYVKGHMPPLDAL